MSGGVAECYAFSRLQENVSLGNLPAIRHVKCADAIIVDDYPLGGDTVLLFGVLHIEVVDQLGQHALGDFRCVGVAANRVQELIHVHTFTLRLFQFQPQRLDLLADLALFFFISF